MQESLVPYHTLDQLKYSAKLIRKYLKSIGVDLTHSTALDVASNGFGYANYNIAKASIEKREMPHAKNIEYQIVTPMFPAESKSIKKGILAYYCGNPGSGKTTALEKALLNDPVPTLYVFVGKGDGSSLCKGNRLITRLNMRNDEFLNYLDDALRGDKYKRIAIDDFEIFKDVLGDGFEGVQESLFEKLQSGVDIHLVARSAMIIERLLYDLSRDVTDNLKDMLDKGVKITINGDDVSFKSLSTGEDLMCDVPDKHFLDTHNKYHNEAKEQAGALL